MSHDDADDRDKRYILNGETSMEGVRVLFHDCFS